MIPIKVNTMELGSGNWVLKSLLLLLNFINDLIFFAYFSSTSLYAQQFIFLLLHYFLFKAISQINQGNGLVIKLFDTSCKNVICDNVDDFMIV